MCGGCAFTLCGRTGHLVFHRAMVCTDLRWLATQNCNVLRCKPKFRKPLFADGSKPLADASFDRVALRLHKSAHQA
jgi:hypothetical protein